MKPKTLILMLVAVGCGLCAAYLAATINAGPNTANTLPVVVAQMDMPAGTVIKEPDKMVQIRPFLAESAPVEGQRLTNIEDVRNKSIGRNILKGEPILARDFSEQGAILRPAPPGYRAVTIRVTLDSALAGFALPGARVDLVCTRTNPANQNQTIAETFMENVLVLAVNAIRTDTTPESKNGVIATPSVVTLAAKPIDAARIIWAKEKGHITLTLRRPGEDEDSNIPPVTELNTVDDGTPGRRSQKQMVKVWVARETIFPGQIDRPEQAFRLEEVPPTFAEEAIRGPNPPPVGRLYSLVAKGMPVTLWHYKASGVVDPTRPMPKDKPIIMSVWVGGKEPHYFRFTPNGHPLDDGKPVEGPAPVPQGGEGAVENP
jgi:pilus assembly protein CpaB